MTAASTTAAAFSAAMPAWKANQETPWGRLRYRIIQANLADQLPAAPLRIIDVGGGNGVESIPLAQAGHHVTLIDASTGMLQEAQQAADVAGVAAQMQFIQLDAHALPDHFAEDWFDVALFHNVIQYISDAEAVLTRIRTILKPAGLLSLVTLNPVSEVLGLALREQDPSQALAALGAKERAAVVIPGATMIMRTADELIDLLTESKFTFVKQYGVRSLMDYMPNNALKHKEAFYNELERLELAVRDQYPYYLFARFYHLIARKR
ncbi:MAG TPA: methyltransferase domain-containing protein [Caldilineaceae bacterium]|nr:methyltransferase domain-containing protein [Caldilineaceae bacterium]